MPNSTAAPPPTRRKWLIRITLSALLSLSVSFWSHALWIHAKALVAQQLIHNAWQITLETQTPNKPWPWADTWPVAALELPDGEKLYVLAGAHGSSLAFGPGHIDGTSLPGQAGTPVISGHRDTHFRFLEEVKHGDSFRLQGQDGQWQHYAVRESVIRDIQDGPWWVNDELDELHLITCYPFNAVNPGTPLRYVVVADKVTSVPAAQLATR